MESRRESAGFFVWEGAAGALALGRHPGLVPGSITASVA
jgi:hypothetical protein